MFLWGPSYVPRQNPFCVARAQVLVLVQFLIRPLFLPKCSLVNFPCVPYAFFVAFKVLPVRSFSLSSLPLHVSGALNMRSPRENSVHFPKCSSMNSLFDSFCVNEWILCVCKFPFVGRPSHAAIRKFTLVQFQTAIQKLRGLVRIIPEPCAFIALDKSYADALRARLACTELLLNVYLTGGCDIYHSLSGLKIKCLIRGT